MSHFRDSIPIPNPDLFSDEDWKEWAFELVKALERIHSEDHAIIEVNPNDTLPEADHDWVNRFLLTRDDPEDILSTCIQVTDGSFEWRTVTLT